MAAVTTHKQPLEYLGGVRRFAVSEDKVSWSTDYPEYQPVDYTAPRVLAQPAWADPDIRSLTKHCPMLYIDGGIPCVFDITILCLPYPLPIHMTCVPITAGSSHQRNLFSLTHLMGK